MRGKRYVLQTMWASDSGLCGGVPFLWLPGIRRSARGGERAVSTGGWFLMLFLVGIPLVGLILLLAWAFSGSTNSSKQNWARAALIWAVIVIMLAAAFGGGGTALVAGRLGRLA